MSDSTATTTAPATTVTTSSKSMPGSRRNSQDGLWQTLAKMNLGADTSRPDTSGTTPGTSSAVFPGTFSDAFLREDGETSKMSTSLLGSSKQHFMKMNDDAFPILVQRDERLGLLSSGSSALDLATYKSQTAALGGEWASYASAESAEQHRPLYSRARMSRMSLENMTGSAATAGSTGLSEGKGLDRGFGTTKSTPPKGGLLSGTFGDMSMGMDSTPSGSMMLAGAPGMCKFYLQGFCARGDLCQHSHGMESTGSLRGHASSQGGLFSSGAYESSYGMQQGVTPMLGSGGGSMLASMHHPGAVGYEGGNGMGGQGPAFFPYPMYPVFPGQMPNGMFAYPHALGMPYGMPMGDMNGSLKGKSKRHRRGVGSLQSGSMGGGNGGNNSGGEEGANRYNDIPLEELTAEIPEMCRDQHGCRYLQKKLEEGRRKYINLIFTEVIGQVVELMTDPFGNYLCQKLLEYCGDEQRTVIVETVAPEMVQISLNMHGTRAVQKLIEFLSNPKQICIVITALTPHVVTLIKDLNGNHVIQKCLNRLSSTDNQFIYDAVSEHCVEVSTHRHGCCVMQRCIDHAADHQKVQLAIEITRHALALVQDPFGNYVVQYVLDLLEPRFNEPLVRRFYGQVVQLSMQKFSSNVIEKCIRVCDAEARRTIVDEMMSRKDRLDRMLRDGYANYVVQTALDYSDSAQRQRLVECLRPLLPAVRNTPYGKRIQAKLYKGEQGPMPPPPPMQQGQNVPVPIPIHIPGPPGQSGYMAYPLPVNVHPGVPPMPNGSNMYGIPPHQHPSMNPPTQFGMIPITGNGHAPTMLPSNNRPPPPPPSSYPTSPSAGAFLPAGIFPSSPPLIPNATTTSPPPGSSPPISGAPDHHPQQPSMEFMTSVGMMPSQPQRHMDASYM